MDPINPSDANVDPKPSDPNTPSPNPPAAPQPATPAAGSSQLGETAVYSLPPAPVVP